MGMRRGAGEERGVVCLFGLVWFGSSQSVSQGVRGLRGGDKRAVLYCRDKDENQKTNINRRLISHMKTLNQERNAGICRVRARADSAKRRRVGPPVAAGPSE